MERKDNAETAQVSLAAEPAVQGDAILPSRQRVSEGRTTASTTTPGEDKPGELRIVQSHPFGKTIPASTSCAM